MEIKLINGSYNSPDGLDYYVFVIYKENFFWVKNPSCTAMAVNLVNNELRFPEGTLFFAHRDVKCCSILRGVKQGEKPSVEMLPKTYQKKIKAAK